MIRNLIKRLFLIDMFKCMRCKRVFANSYKRKFHADKDWVVCSDCLDKMGSLY